MVQKTRPIHDHKNNKFNRECIEVEATDDRQIDNANHEYRINVWSAPQDGRVVYGVDLKFQNGGLAEVGANGITDQALIAIVLDRIRGFNEGPYRCRENSMMITKLEEALMWGEKRANDRSRRGVEGERKA